MGKAFYEKTDVSLFTQYDNNKINGNVLKYLINTELAL